MGLKDCMEKIETDLPWVCGSDPSIRCALDDVATSTMRLDVLAFHPTHNGPSPGRSLSPRWTPSPWQDPLPTSDSDYYDQDMLQTRHTNCSMYMMVYPCEYPWMSLFDCKWQILIYLVYSSLNFWVLISILFDAKLLSF